MPYNFNYLKTRASEIGEWLTKELATIRTGRATPALLDGVQVESYGARSPLKQIGSINIEDTRSLRITLWDKTQLKAVETALAQANIGVSVTTDANSLRVNFPELTADKRKTLTKLAHDKVEEAKVTLRKEREKIWSEIQVNERDGKIGEDEKFRLKDELQKIVDEETKKLAAAGERKVAEIGG